MAKANAPNARMPITYNGSIVTEQDYADCVCLYIAVFFAVFSGPTTTVPKLWTVVPGVPL